MIKNYNLPKAYTEVIAILNHMSKEEVEQIPQYILDNMYNEMDLDYEFEIEDNKSFEDLRLLDETKTILAVLFRNYWATNLQRKRIILNERKNINSDNKN